MFHVVQKVENSKKVVQKIELIISVLAYIFTLLTPPIKIKWPCKSNIYKAIFVSRTKFFLGFNKEDRSLMIYLNFVRWEMRKRARVLFLFL